MLTVERLSRFERLTRSWSRHPRTENKSPRTLETYGEAVGQFVKHVAARVSLRESWSA
jgi:hypothetical protein